MLSRLPCATAATAVVTSFVGQIRSSISVLTEDFNLAPGTVREAEFHAMTGLALATDELADALDLLGHALIGCNDIVESIRDLAEEAVFLAGHPHGKVAGAHCA